MVHELILVPKADKKIGPFQVLFVLEKVPCSKTFAISVFCIYAVCLKQFHIFFLVLGSSWYRKEEEKIRIKEAVCRLSIGKAKPSWLWFWELEHKSVSTAKNGVALGKPVIGP